MAFEFDGEKYRKASVHQKEWAHKTLSELDLKGDESILDLGCGDGAVTNQLARMVPNGAVLGIDASEGMIRTALESRKSENVNFELRDINELNYRNQFDLIFSNAALHWVTDHRKLLQNCFSALKSGGTIRFNFAADGNSSHFYRIVKEAVKKEQFREFFKDFSWPWFMPDIETYKTIAAETAFSETEIRGENADRYFPNREAMTEWIDQPSIVPFLNSVPDSEKQHFRNYVVERMIEETEKEDGTCFETFRRVNINAVKRDCSQHFRKSLLIL